MTLNVDIPTLESERLILRAPRIEDTEGFIALYASERAKFIGGPNEDRKAVGRAFGHFAGLWLLRGYGSFVAEEKSNPGVPIGSFGPWFPYEWPEMELGWTIWSGEYEGKGYATEAMKTIMPWAWERTGLDTACSFIDDGNEGSVRVAEALGARFDAETTEAINAPGGVFSDLDVRVRAFRHHRKDAA